MRIRRISIKNFRGIRQLVWNVPDSALLCLIGRGDSTKSTILEALRRVFHPQWNLGFDDADFFQCDPANTICIDATVGNIPDQFRDLGELRAPSLRLEPAKADPTWRAGRYA